MSEKLVMIGALVTEDVKKALQKEAKRQKRTLSRQVAFIIEMYLQEIKNLKAPETEALAR